VLELTKTQQKIFSAKRQGNVKQGRATLGRPGGQGKAWQVKQAGQHLASKALGAVPNGVLVPTRPAANWSMLVLPTKMAPAKEKSAFDAHVLCKIRLARYGLRHGSVRIMFIIISDEREKTPRQRGWAGCGGWQAGDSHDSHYAGELRRSTCHNVGM